MKNTIRYEGLPHTESNVINIERLLFYKAKEKQIKPKVKISNTLSLQIIDHIKNFLAQDRYRSLIRDSFGNTNKQEQLREVLFSHVSSEEFLSSYSSLITDYSLDQVADALVEKIAGIGVLQSLTEIPTVTDIKCINWDSIWVDDIEKGQYKTDIRFESEQDYIELCHRFAYASSKAFSPARPSVNAMFPYMRVNIVGFDLSPKTSLSIRIISKELRLTEDYMIQTGYANKEMVELLKKTFATEAHLISGATGTGKTELLRFFTRYCKTDSNIIMIEDTPETYLDEIYEDFPFAINMWKNREASDDSKKEYGYSYHIRNAMRQNPDYIFLQESLGKESADVLKATETGHIVNTTLHASSALNAVQRFISLCQESYNHSAEYYGRRIVTGFKIGIHTKRFGAVRKINQIVEYVSFEDGQVKGNVLFEYDPISQRHIQKDKMSLELWNNLLEEHHDLDSIQALAPLEMSVSIN